MKEYFKLLRVKHYIKNILLFIPMFFAGSIFDVSKLAKCIVGFLCFCLTSSVVYILNDKRDVEKDKKHPTKKNRPLASGKIKPRNALIISIIFLIIVVAMSVWLKSIEGGICLILYFGLNIAYSMGLKNRPIVDIVILASGFVIRVFYGGYITGIEISKWLYLVVISGSLYMGLGKRRNELKMKTETREVLKYYNEAFLDKNMYVCVSCANIFYTLWTLDMSNPQIIWTVPIFFVILMCYSLDTEGDSDGDPVEVILKNKMLIGLVLLYAIVMFMMLYTW